MAYAFIGLLACRQCETNIKQILICDILMSLDAFEGNQIALFIIVVLTCFMNISTAVEYIF